MDFKLCFAELQESKEYEQTWEAIDDLVYSIDCICDPEHNSDDAYPITDIVKGVKDFLNTIPRRDKKKSMKHLLIFQFQTAVNALVTLFSSPIKGNKEMGEEAIQLFLIDPESGTGFLPNQIQNQCALIVLQLCNLLDTGEAATNDELRLYSSCRQTLMSILKSIAFAKRSTYFGFMDASLVIKLLYPLFSKLYRKLISSFSTTTSNCSRTSFARDVREFALISLHMRREIVEHVRSKGQSLPLCVDDVNFSKNPCFLFQIVSFHEAVWILISKVTSCLSKLHNYADEAGGSRRVPKFNPMWSYYLFSLLKILNDTSKLYQGAEDTFFALLEGYQLQINYLIIHSKRTDEYQWILARNGVTNVESRRHLMMMMMMMFPVASEMPRRVMLIDRSQLLPDSFEQIALANPKDLHNGLTVVFKNEGSVGPGVLREWLFLVCQHLFNPQNSLSLFLACPSDRRRFFPNPAKMDLQRLSYFRFCGRVFALALMHKVRVGITFDRVFFLQLAGKKISLEDVRDADPCMYKSCKKILEMDADFVDSDAMGLTFVNEIEEFGSRKLVELCPGGNTIVVNSKNREEYVNLLIQHCFVKSISEKVAYFAQGFGDILRNPWFQKIFFRALELKDLDYLLLGNDKAICVEDWKAHTNYNGYKETDDQICWFWKEVESMSSEQQCELLFFWTSVKYLPVNGFAGLTSRLCIYKTKGSDSHLPSSHTCFHRLDLPPYSSPGVLQRHVSLICQEYVGCGFGLGA